jgi:hypothetical protein
MGYICPVCNGYGTVEVRCTKCHESMENKGTVMDYVGPYAPYENDSILLASEFDRTCLHLFTCSKCGNMERVTVQNDYLG